MDDGDRAQQTNALRIEDGIAAARQNLTRKPSRFDCLDCEEPIPEARRQALPGVERCIDCQTLLENWRPT